MRIILVDNHSGYIFGDSAQFAPRGEEPRNILAAARMLDESLNEFGRLYVEQPRSNISGRSGYLCYRSDIGGSDQMPNVTDGQDPELIAICERDCKYLGFVETLANEDIDPQIEALRLEAEAAGDDAQVALCQDALCGNVGARVECARVISDAAIERG